jgi:hypothetical protein
MRNVQQTIESLAADPHKGVAECLCSIAASFRVQPNRVLAGNNAHSNMTY